MDSDDSDDDGWKTAPCHREYGTCRLSPCGRCGYVFLCFLRILR